MRDILITFLVILGCFYTLRKAYIGILLWSWLSYMNPHRLAYGYAYDMPFAQITAITLLFSMIFSRETRKPPFNNLTLTWVIFVLFMGLSTIFAYFPDAALEQYIKIIKIQFVTFLTLLLITDLKKLNHLIWVIVLSIGFFSIKGGAFTLLTGGSYRVWGPPDSFIEDNNSLAVAVLMAIPLMIYLYQISSHKMTKMGLAAGSVLSLFTIIGSQSRGAFLAIAVVGFAYWIKSKHKMLTGLFIAMLGIGLLAFAPESWYARMDSIRDYQEDGSALGRLNAWIYAYNVANDNLLGAGLNSWNLKTFFIYAPNPTDVHAAHSIYFSVLADHGWIGLFLFLVIFYLSWKKLRLLTKNTDDNPDFYEMNLLARKLQISFIAYFVGGAFLSLSYFDLPWHMVSFVVILNRIFDEQRHAMTESQAQVTPSFI